MLGLISSPLTFLARIRKKGILRPSKYDFETRTLQAVTKKILALKLTVPDEVNDYILTMRKLYLISTEVSSLEKRVIFSLKKGKEKFLRQVLIDADFSFMLQAMDKWHADKESSSEEVYFYNPEELADAVSYIVYLYHTHIGNIGYLKLETDTTGLDSTEIIIAAAKIRAFYEFEINIDAFKYTLLESEEGNVFVLRAQEESFERALRLGYIQTEIQGMAAHASSRHKDRMGLKDVGQHMHEALHEHIVKFMPAPLPRYTLQAPIVPPFTEPLATDKFYAEEAMMLEYYSREWGVSPDDLLVFEIEEGLTVQDLMKAQRVFNILRWVMISHLAPRLETERANIANSLVPVFTDENLKIILNIVAEGKAERLINFLARSRESDGVYDILYQPILMSGEQYIIPCNILANANFFRNSLQLSRKRFFPDGQNDPLVHGVYSAMERQTKEVASNRAYSWKGYVGELDVVALIDDKLFVVECKNSILPCNPHEARTSYDYIVEASSQLDRFSEAFHTEGFVKYLEKTLGWKIGKPKLITSIVMSNRMFSGYRINQHAVRGALEFINFIETGLVTMGDEKLCLWSGEKFSAYDLDRYLTEDIGHIRTWKGMRETKALYTYGKFKVECDSYYLDFALVAKAYGFEKTARMIAEQKQKFKEDNERKQP
jgi:hypothetical protein